MATQLFIAFCAIVFTLSAVFIPQPVWLRACFIIGGIIGWILTVQIFFK